jgi:hypothetical protein
MLNFKMLYLQSDLSFLGNGNNFDVAYKQRLDQFLQTI